MKKKKILPRIFFSGILILAALADLKYKGKFYQMLPKPFKRCADDFWDNKK